MMAVPQLTLRFCLISCWLATVVLADNTAQNCNLPGYDLTALSSMYWAVPVAKEKCDGADLDCTIVFSACPKTEIPLCLHNSCVLQNQSAHSFGNLKPIETQDSGIKLLYSRSDDEHSDALIVEVDCDSEKHLQVGSGSYIGTFEANDISKLQNGYRLKASYSFACKSSTGMGPGAQMIIILLVMALVYLCGGIAYNHVNGLRGEELIPHLWFWKNFPNYVVDGCMYFVRLITCQTSTGYTQNPDYGSTSPAGLSPSGRSYENL